MSLNDTTPEDWDGLSRAEQAMYRPRKVPAFADLVDRVKQAKEEFDNVDCPQHYNKGGVECIEAIKAAMDPEVFKGYLKGNAMKYLWRYEDKGKPVEDLRKCIVYLNWLLEEEL